MLIIYTYFFNKRARENYRANLVDLIKERSKLEFYKGVVY